MALGDLASNCYDYNTCPEIISAVQFSDVSIPKGAVITGASITFTSWDHHGNPSYQGMM